MAQDNNQLTMTPEMLRLALHAELRGEVEAQRLEYQKAMAVSQPGTLPSVLATHNERIYALLLRVVDLLTEKNG